MSFAPAKSQLVTHFRSRVRVRQTDRQTMVITA